MRTRIALMILLAAGAAAAQQSTLTQPTPRVLVESSSQILEVPHFSTMGSPLCDDKGDVFFHVPLTSNSFTDSSVMKLSARSSDPVMFQLSKDLLYKYVFGYFSVTPSGKVGFLDANVEDPAKEGILYVFGFDSDGEMESQVKLDIPEHLSPDGFGVSQSGVIFLAGHFSSGAPKPLQGKRFDAFFEKSGKLRTEMKTEELDVDLKAIGSMNGGNVAIGPDGYFYFLRPDKILVISESGETVRSIPFQMPSPDMSASTLRLSAGLASIELHKIEESGRIQSEFLVLDADTGDTYGLYLPPESVGASLCFSRSTGFIFLAKDGKKDKLVTAAMR
jgi:hypothetical protein